ncbi:unnamed protein product [Acanthosepion pharaonis]|uniref:Uncharacterized protein n=1 Tax=Acanthosepion pharaonis TaxID=158019 RepID=A0A812ELU3_ACAPH|nr:unnamed protein product [Sepia pharaonis]
MNLFDSVSEDINAIVAPDSVSEDINAIVAPDSVSEDINAIFAPDSISEDINPIVAPDSVSEDINAIVAPDSVSEDINAIVAPDSISEDINAIVAPDSVSEDINAIVAPDTPNYSNAVTSQISSNSEHKFSTSATFIPTTARPNPVYQSTTTARMNMCFCPCRFPRKNISAEEFKESLKEIVINKKDTSSYKRSKISSPDERTSSKAIGMVAIVVTVIPFSLLILSDVPILVCQVIATYKRIIKGNP